MSTGLPSMSPGLSVALGSTAKYFTRKKKEEKQSATVAIRLETMVLIFCTTVDVLACVFSKIQQLLTEDTQTRKTTKVM